MGSPLHRARSVACVPDSHKTSYVLAALPRARIQGGEGLAQICNAEKKPRRKGPPHLPVGR
jgi:hypothetical protein